MIVRHLPDGDSAGTFLGHPKGLFVLFFAEMWERFSYYGMRALLIFYLTKWWLFDDGKANLIYGAYTSLVYITPMLGGYLADRYLGQRKAVQFGAVLLTIGHLMMAVEGTPGGHMVNPAINIFWLALAFIIVGSGFLKANISVIVGQLYPLTDVRRDGAYTIFYVGVNLGAFIGTIIAGWLGETYGWRYGFGAAGVGMALGLVVFVLGRGKLLGRGEPPEPLALARRHGGISLEWLLYGLSTASVAVIWAVIQFQNAIGWLLLVSGFVLLGYIVYEAITKLGREARNRILAVIFLILLNPIFWGLYEQGGGSTNIFTDRYVDRSFMGVEISASLYQSVNPLFIFTLGPLFTILWTMLGRRGWEPSTPAKFGMALLLVGLSFLSLVWGAEMVGIEKATPAFFIWLLYFFQTTGELCLSPVGLSAMNRLAPRHMASLIMGAWFFGTAGGDFVAGKIGEATGTDGGASTKASILEVYGHIGWLGIAMGVVVLVVAPLVNRLMHLDTLSDKQGDEEILVDPIPPTADHLPARRG
ncbi:MAG TPA: peptide MFS transporter [Sphingobium sp.]|uniref:peptide MFS transporter n=1 Tax=Sphingobium sp. TaxID=1912891 RepID=UPI002ED614D1